MIELTYPRTSARGPRPRAMRLTAVFAALCVSVLLAQVGTARADDRPTRVERSAAEIEREARLLADLLERGLDDDRDRVWRDGEGRIRSVKALFLINRLAGSARAFRQLAATTRQSYTRAALSPAYDLLFQDTRDVADVLEREIGRGSRRGRYSLAGRRSDELLDCFDRLQREVDRLSFVKQLAEERDFGRGFDRDDRDYGRFDRGGDRDYGRFDRDSLRITTFECPNRKEYTYRANICVEGDSRVLDRTLIRLAFVKKLNIDLDPWEREVTIEERVAVQGIGNGEERRCYFARQIGKEVRVQDRDNVYLILNPARGRPVVQACFQANQLDPRDVLRKFRR